MVDLTRRQRELLADKLPDFANVAAAGLVFGQFASGQAISARVAVAGFAVWTIVIVLSVMIAGRRQ
jgi:hypothetical protein